MLLSIGSRSAAVRKAFWARHKGGTLVKRLQPHQRAIFHERTLHALHRSVQNDPKGKKGLGLIIAQRRLRARAK